MLAEPGLRDEHLITQSARASHGYKRRGPARLQRTCIDNLTRRVCRGAHMILATVRSSLPPPRSPTMAMVAGLLAEMLIVGRREVRTLQTTRWASEACPDTGLVPSPEK